MKEVVKKEVQKLLEAGVIYPILDSAWVSPIQVVSKKDGMILFIMRKMKRYMCIDYRKLTSHKKRYFSITFYGSDVGEIGKQSLLFLFGWLFRV